MDDRKLGIFGDSFAHIAPTHLIDESIGRRPWPLTLGKLLNKELSVHSRVATSTWYSYKKFLENYKDLDIVVFCYSSNHRWHNINAGDGGPPIHHIITSEQLKHAPLEYEDVAKKLVDIHPYIFDPDLDLFIIQNVFNSINDICRENGIRIVNVLTFEETYGIPLSIDISNNAGVVLTNLSEIANSEYLTRDQKPRDKEIAHKILNFPDYRFCHLNPHNNTALAHIIKHCLDNKIEYINLIKDSRFSLDVEHNRYLLDL